MDPTTDAGQPASPAQPPRLATPSDRICAMPATELAAAIRAKAVSPIEATDAVLRRIEELNPRLNAYCTVTAELARTTARAAEDAVVRGEMLGPLHGVPYSLKDLTPTAGIRTTYGSKLFEHHVPTTDAVVFERLRAAGAILVGKTNTPDEGTKGVTDNLVFGATANPWDLSRTPGGSSGGAAAAVAAGMGPLAEGSDYAGSVRIPASFCGVAGLKPSDGRIPNAPAPMAMHAIAFSHGPLARTIADVALMLQVLAGPDARDPRSLADGPHDFPAAVADEATLAGVRIGLLPDLGFVPVEPVVAEAVRRAAQTLEGLGAVIEQDDTSFADSVAPYSLLNGIRRAALMAPYYPERRDEMDPLLAWRVEFSAARSATEVAQAEMAQTEIYHRVRGLFERYDLLLLPTTPVPAFPLGQDFPREIAGRRIDNPFQQLPLTFLFNLTGHPAISLPAGFTDEGLPLGVQLAGPWRDDAAVLRAAASFERAAPWADRWPALVSRKAGR